MDSNPSYQPVSNDTLAGDDEAILAEALRHLVGMDVDGEGAEMEVAAQADLPPMPQRRRTT